MAMLRLPTLSLAHRILLQCVAAVIVAVAIIGAGTINAEVKQAEAIARDALRIRLAVFEEVLRPHGTVWRGDGDRMLLGDTVLNGRNDIVDAISRLGGVATLFLGDRRIATTVPRPDGSRAIGTQLAAGAAHDSAIGRGQLFEGRNAILGTEYLTIYKPVHDAAGKQVGLLFVGTRTADVAAVTREGVINVAIPAAVVVVVISLIGMILLQRSFRPFNSLRAATDRIAAGELDVLVPGTARRDEVGQLARSLDHLRGQALRARALEADAGEARHAADQARAQARQDLAVLIEGEIGRVAGTLSSSVDSVGNAADAIARQITTVSENANTAAQGAADAQGNVRNVTESVDVLAGLVVRITGQVAEAGSVVRRAVSETAATDAAVQKLSEAATRIGNVVKLISDIAGQTNLLALNATIEAARAGDAGKGFAVVASEVKQLAGQTAKATGDISEQIVAIQAATQDAVQSIRGIGTVVGEIEHIAGAIAEAVDAQAAAAEQIATTVSVAATGTGQVAACIGGLTGNVDATLDAVSSLRGTAETLATKGQALDQAVARVLAGLQQAA